MVKIYPSNWLMAAGIVGFYKIFKESEFYIVNDNLLEIDFNKAKEEFFKNYFNKAKEFNIPLKVFYNNSRVSNNRFKKENNIDIDKTNNYFFESIEDDQNLICSFCNERKAIKRKEIVKEKADKNTSKATKRKKKNNKQTTKYSLIQLDEVHFTPLGSSPENLANLYWEGNPSHFLCLPCELIIYCAAFGFTKVGKHYIFINAPTTVKEIIEINEIWAEYLKQGGSKTFKDSLIEILKRIERTKAKWTLQNISFIELAPVLDKTGKATTTFNIFSFSIPPEVAHAIKKLIQSYPKNLRDIYDIFLDYIYSSKPLYDMVGNIVYGYLSKERLNEVDNRTSQKSSVGRLVLSGKVLENTRDLLFFLKFQKEVEEYGQ